MAADGKADASAMGPAMLMTGLRTLRAKGILCDAVLVADTDSRFRVHQAVLAAASGSLRKYLAGVEPGSAEAGALPREPRPLELRLEGAVHAESLKSVLDHIYGEAPDPASPAPTPEATAELGQLAAALQLPGLQSSGGADASAAGGEAIASGLRALQAEGLFCDVVLVAAGAPDTGSTRALAHSAVLAAASAQLRRCIIEGLEQELPAVEAGEEAPEAASDPFELELQVNHPEALHAMLAEVYGEDPTLDEGAVAVNLDVVRLALAFELPHLQKRAERCLAQGASAANSAELMADCEKLGLVALKKEIAARFPVTSPPLPLVPSLAEGRPRSLQDIFDRARASPPAAAAKKPAASSAASPGNSPGPSARPSAEEALAGDEGADETEELDVVKFYRAMACISVADKKVPAVAPPAAEELSGQLNARQEKLMARLHDLFDRRPIWLEGPLKNELSADPANDILRLLPSVAYQWKDGPWANAYARIGWDPRGHSKEAMELQVIPYRDPYFSSQGGGAKAAKEVDGGKAVDCSFRRPPTKKTVHYQLLDIEDDFVNSFVAGADPLKKFDKKTGWVDQFILDCIKDRLDAKSQEMREKEAARAAAAAARAKAGKGKAARLHSGSGGTPMKKKARIGGG
mmetsp:Transcript_60038/g.128851  ORF Transcript_60038/g.128851 Transcript_60038/m.128851 type:complete len:634 (-) Transcript_60038:82-1983(-)